MNTEDIITKCIVLKTVNYQENDKILTLFSVDLGKISASLKGCRKPNAKLKHVGQPFCFAEFSLSGRGEKFVVTDAFQIETFFQITQNYDALRFASAMLEMCNYVLNDGEANSELFLMLLKSLKAIADNPENANSIFIKFCFALFKNQGYELMLSHCSQCGGQFSTNVLFDYDLGNFVCGLCRGNFCDEVKLNVFGTLKLLNNSQLNKVASVKALPQVFADINEILLKNFEQRFGRKIKSLN